MKRTALIESKLIALRSQLFDQLEQANLAMIDACFDGSAEEEEARITEYKSIKRRLLNIPFRLSLIGCACEPIKLYSTAQATGDYASVLELCGVGDEVEEDGDEAIAYQQDLIADPEPTEEDSDGSLKLYCVSWLNPLDPPGKQAHAAILYASDASDAIVCAEDRFGVLVLPRVVRVMHPEHMVGLEVGRGTEL